MVRWNAMPMCLVLRPEDEKIISVSQKKIIVDEECYAKFSSVSGMYPFAGFEVPRLYTLMT
jgi:hypothetical protein